MTRSALHPNVCAFIQGVLTFCPETLTKKELVPLLGEAFFAGYEAGVFYGEELTSSPSEDE